MSPDKLPPVIQTIANINIEDSSYVLFEIRNEIEKQLGDTFSPFRGANTMADDSSGTYFANHVLFRGIQYEKEHLETLQKQGTRRKDTSHIYVHTEEEIVQIADGEMYGRTALQFARDTERAGIPVVQLFDGSKLKPYRSNTGGPVEYAYCPKEGESFRSALIAIMLFEE